MSEGFREPELTAVEAALGTLTPHSGLNRDRLLFRAGQASVHWGRFGLAASTVLGLATIALGAVLLFRPAPSVENIVYVYLTPPEPAPPQVSELPSSPLVVHADLPERETELPPVSYLNLRNQVTRWGLAALPTMPPGPARGQGRSLEEALGLPRGTLKRVNTSPWQSSQPIGEPL